MTRIDFYILPDDSPANRLKLICRLAGRVFDRRQLLFIHADSDALLSDLDLALWQQEPVSFLAHRVLDPADEHDALDADPIQLSTGEPGGDRQVLINLAASVPPFFSRFERTLEIVNQDESVRDAGRERFRFYRERGYPLQHHNQRV